MSNVRWDYTEQLKLAPRIVANLRGFPGMGLLEAARKAQDSELPANRQRRLISATNLPDGLRQMIKHLQDQPEKAKEDKPVSVAGIPADTLGLILRDLLRAILRDVLDEVLPDVIVALRQTVAAPSDAVDDSAPHRHDPNPPASDRAHKPHILILGVKAHNRAPLESHYSKQARLSFWRDENPHLLRAKCVGVDAIIASLDGISHPNAGIAEKAFGRPIIKVRGANGAVSSAIEAVLRNF